MRFGNSQEIILGKKKHSIQNFLKPKNIAYANFIPSSLSYSVQNLLRLEKHGLSQFWSAN